jgi:glycosyltransferase involved in cell wall biosynthesis
VPLPGANWAGTVLHGLPESLYRLGSGDGGYLAFLGRISPEKRPDRAIAIATRLGLPLRIAAKVDPVDKAYFQESIAPLLEHPLVDFVGEISEDEKQDFLDRATALLFPIDWDEPFGMVMIESMACGTPVIAFAGGSVPEVLEDALTGFIVHSVDEAVAATKQALTLDRARCRAVFEARFTARRMAEDCVTVYRALIEAAPLRRTGPAG